MPSEVKLLTVKEFHAALSGKIGENRIRAAYQNEEIKHVRIGTKVLIFASEVTDWLDRVSIGGEKAEQCETALAA